MVCPSCGSPNEAGQKSCGESGTRLALACPSCGTANGPTARFCGECGARLDAAATAAGAAASPADPGAVGKSAGPGRTLPPDAAPGAAPQAAPATERRLVSVLFADLAGFTTHSSDRDAEAVRELLTRSFDTAGDIVARSRPSGPASGGGRAPGSRRGRARRNAGMTGPRLARHREAAPAVPDAWPRWRELPEPAQGAASTAAG